MERSTTKISKELLAIPGVQSAGAHIGQALLGEEVAGVNLGEIWVSLAPNADYTKALDRIHSVTLGYPGLFREVLRRGGLEPGADQAQLLRHREPADRPAVGRPHQAGRGRHGRAAAEPQRHRPAG